MGVIDELVTLIRFDMPAGATATLKKAESGISSLTGRLKDLGIVAVATGAVTAALSANAANEATELTKLSEATGLSTERLQALAAVYKEVGGSAANAGRDARAFYDRTNGMTLDENNVDMISQWIKGMEDGRAIQKLAAMGFSEDIFRYLKMDRQFRKERMEYNKQNNTLGDAEKAKLADLSTAMAVFTTGLGDTSAKMQAALAPSITTALNDIVEWLDANEDDIVSGMEAIGGGFTRAWGTFKDFGEDASEALGPAWESLDEFVNKHGGWEEAIGSLTVAVGGLGTALAAISVPKGLLTLAGMLTGLDGGKAAGKAAAGGAAAAEKGVLGRIFGFAGKAIASAAASSAGYEILNDIQKDVNQGVKDRITEVNEKIESASSVHELYGLKDEAFSAYANRAIPIYGSDSIFKNFDALQNIYSGTNRIDEKINTLISEMSEEERTSAEYDYNPGADRILRMEVARFREREREKAGRDGSEDSILSDVWSAIKYTLGPGESIQRLRDSYKESQINVTQENNFYGVKGAEQAVPAIKDAAAMGAQSGVQSAFKNAVPDGYIEVH